MGSLGKAKRTKMKLQLENGNLARPISLVEDFVLSSCGIEFVHTLALVNFGLKSIYDIFDIQFDKHLDYKKQCNHFQVLNHQ